MSDALKWIEISTRALSANIAEARRLLRTGTALGAVVKANAYGHGIAVLAPILEGDPMVDAFCVVNVDEAKALRSLGARKKIVLIGHFDASEAEEVVRLNLIPFAFPNSALDALDKAAANGEAKVDVILKVDTGMGRLGVRSDSVADALERLRRLTHLNLAGFATHFAESDAKDSTLTIRQKRVFNEITLAHSRKIAAASPMNTASNSGGILAHPDAHHDLVRFGIGLYGLHPSPHTAGNSSANLRPILEYKAKVIHVADLKKGESVSYGATWTADKDAKIAVLPIGYSDGYLRAYGKGGGVLINGAFRPIRGRVCMNFTMVDVSETPTVSVGDTATIISRDENSPCSVDALAEIAGTINYEVTTILPAHLPRIAVK